MVSPPVADDIFLLDRPAPGLSLAEQALAGLRARFGGVRRAFAPTRFVVGARSLRLAAAMVLTLPLSICIGANLLAVAAEQEAEAFAAEASLGEEALRQSGQIEEARREFARSLRTPSVSEVAQSLARSLPAGVFVDRIEQDAHGRLTLRVSAPDPDVLRRALLQSPHLASLREVDQAQAEDGALRVTLRSAAR